MDKKYASRRESLDNRTGGPAVPSARAFEELLNGMDIALFALDRDFRYVHLNDRAALYLGRPKEEMLGKSVWEVFPAFRGSENEARYRTVLEQGKPVRFESFNPSLSRWFDIYAYPAGDGFAVRAEDITDRKHIEEELRDNEERLRLATEAAGLGTWDLDMVSDVAARSLRHDQIWGYTELQPEWGFEIAMRNVVAEDRPVIMEAYEKGIKSGTLSHENRVVWPDGSIHWIHAYGRFIYDAEGKPVRVMGIVEDITDRKNTEERIRNSERELRGITDNSQDVITRFDRELRHTFINPYGEKVYGKKREEILGKTNAELGMPPDKVAFWKKNFEHVLAAGTAVKVEFDFDGPVFGRQDFISTFVPEFDGNGTVQSVLAITRDVTDMKTTERELRTNSARLEATINSMPDAVFILDSGWNITLFNEAYATYHRFGNKEEATRHFDRFSDLFEVFNPEGTPAPPESWATYRAMMGETVSVAEYRIHRTDTDEWWWGSYNSAPILLGDGSMIGAVVTARDITDHKKAEEALKEREATLDAFFANAPGILTLMDADLRFINTDVVTPTYFGLDRNSLVGKSIWDLNPPNAEDVHGPLVKQILETGKSVSIVFEGPVPSRPGETAWFSATYFPVPLPGGKTGMGAMAVDITAVKRAQKAIEESEDRFRTLADNISQLAWMAEPDGSIFWYNRQWYDYTGTGFEEMRGWGWKAVHHPDHVDRVVEKFSRYVRSGERWEDTFPLRGRDGEFRWFLSRAVPIRNDAGIIVRWFGTNTDITELKETQGRLEKSNAELEQFAYVASHDLQEPLRMVASYTELLEQFYGEHFDERGRRYMNYVVDGAKRMQQLIQDLLSFSRVGRTNTEKRRIDCNHVLETVVTGYQAKIEKTGAAVTSDRLPAVLANQTSLVQLFQNLVGNALKFHKPGVPPRVHVSARKQDSMWLFSVEDSGIGIEPEYYEKIFVVFQRLHGKDEYPGTGIGLAICRKIVESYGGKIWVESEPGKGATFRFTLPAAGGDVK